VRRQGDVHPALDPDVVRVGALVASHRLPAPTQGLWLPDLALSIAAHFREERLNSMMRTLTPVTFVTCTYL
jgi:hypothetical protein